MSEKCMESCPDLARLERQVKELQRQNGEDHKEIRDRLSRAEMTNAVQNERYDAILGKLEELSRKHDGLTRKLEELEAKNGKYIRFILSDANRASNLLAYQFKARDCQIEDEYTLILMDASLPMPEIIRCFVEHGIAVSDAHLCEDTLEDYFKRVTGGVGIA